FSQLGLLLFVQLDASREPNHGRAGTAVVAEEHGTVTLCGNAHTERLTQHVEDAVAYQAIVSHALQMNHVLGKDDLRVSAHPNPVFELSVRDGNACRLRVQQDQLLRLSHFVTDDPS